MPRELSLPPCSGVLFSGHLCSAVMEKYPELVENAIIVHDDSTAHSAYTVKNVPNCWGASVANTPYSPDLIL